MWGALSTPLSALEFPADFSFPTCQTADTARVHGDLDPNVAQALRTLEHQKNTTLSIVLLTAWKVFIYRYTGQEDLLVSSDTEGPDGFSASSIVIRTHVRGTDRFTDYLDSVHVAVLGAQENQGLSLDRAVAGVDEECDPSLPPLFQAMLVSQNASEYGGEVKELDNGAAKFDLNLSIQPTKGSLSLDLDYNVARFMPETVQRILANYQTLLASIGASPETPVDTLALIDPRERALLLDTWTQTAAPLDRTKSLVSVFETNAAANPGATAVADESTSLTYAELDAQANRLAHYLISQGIGRGEPVPYFLARTVRSVVAVLGILKAGAVYVPLDLMDPVGRRERILSTLKPRLVLTECDLVPTLDRIVDCMPCLDDPDLLAGQETSSPLIPLSGEDAAYIIFTSGSTGNPKGVRCLHQGVINQFEDMQARCPMGPGDVCGLWTAFSFDVSVYETWTCLLAGGTLEILPERVRLNPDTCLDWMRARRVAAGFLPGYMLPALLEVQRRDPIPLRRLLVGVEPLAESLLCDIVAASPGLSLFNSYGPTEATEHVTVYPVRAIDPRPAGNAPIGKPIQNTRLYVLDPAMNPAPIGVHGELYIGGACLAQGYDNDPDLTARQFVPDPFQGGDSNRLYRTGDRVYFRPDGNIQFVQRMGNFIKLRGFRIEPGEIESSLRAHVAIEDAAVVLLEGAGDPQLAAYLATAGGKAMEPGTLEDFLKDRLPSYMIPAQFICVAALPRTVQGKLDRAALPKPPAQHRATDHIDMPETDHEKAVARHWASLLRIDRVGLRDNFFRLGGHSLLLVQLAVRIRKEFQVDVPLRQLMEFPTVAAHAEALQAALAVRGGASEDDVMPPADRTKPIPLSFAQERQWIVDQLQPGSTAYLVPLLVYTRGVSDMDLLREAFMDVVARHEILRTVFSVIGGEPVQLIQDGLQPAVAVINIEGGTPAERAASARAELIAAAQEPIALDKAPLFRLMLFHGAQGPFGAGLVIHHAIFDGWSIGVLLEEWLDRYAARSTGQPPKRTDIQVQYADYAVWQRSPENAPALQAHVAYWKKQLAGTPDLELHTDFPRPPKLTWRGAVAEVSLNVEAADRVTALARSEGKSLFTILAAAWNVLMHRYTGQEDFAIGTVMAGRNNRHTERAIGFFVNTVALRAPVNPALAMRDYFGQMESVVLAAQEHQDAPFEQVVTAVSDGRDQSRTPVFQVVFVLQNTPDFLCRDGEIEFDAETVNPGTAKFDLTLLAQERAGRLDLQLEYNTALFEPRTAERFLGGFVTLLESMSRRPESSVGNLEIVEPAERSRLLGMAGPQVPINAVQSLAAIVADHARRNPDMPAAADAETALTYRELDDRANRVARLLLSQGTGREEPVPFFLSRSVWAIVAILGILKAGGAYVPLDLQDPPARRQRVLKALRPRLILTETALEADLTTSGVSCISLDAPSLLEAHAPDDPALPLGIDDLAYIIFTSGSTGEPKGVACTNRGVINLFEDLHARQPVAPGDHCSVWAALSFDASVYEIWTALLAGAALEIVPEAVRLDPRHCLGWLAARRVKAAYLPGYMMQALSDWQRSAPLPLCRLMVGVEPLRESLLADIVEATPGLTLVNAYGPTEATVYVTLYPVVPTTPKAPGAAPIGMPIQNTQVYILDGGMELVPAGVPGELYVAGAGLARGYFGDPELTSERFVPNPFHGAIPGPLYRTGDVVCLREDGNIQYLRRSGRYIKLRGLRIDPGEIESILRFHPQVEEAAVDLRDDARGEPQLVAYVKPAGDQPLEVPLITEYLAGELPPHMRPGQIVVLKDFPRTVQGKLDRAALPEPPARVAPRESVLPRTVLEERIAALWRASINRAEVGVRANFFDLGGHSLLAIQLVSRINEEFGSALTVQQFFDQPTIEALAALLSSESLAAIAPRSTGGQLLEIKPGTAVPFFCVKGAGDVGGSYDTFASALADDQPFFGFPDLDFPELASEDEAPTVERLAHLCIQEMRRIRPHGPYLIGGYSFGGIVAYEIARQLLEQGESVPLIAILDSGVPGCYESFNGGPFPRVRNLVNRMRVRITVLATCWKMLVGYARDGVRILARRLFHPQQTPANAPSLREYLAWIQLDTSVQYFLIHAGLVTPTIGERRLRMLEEQLVRRTTRSMADAQQFMAAYAFTPIPAGITLFRAEHNPWKTEKYDPTLGWGAYAKGGVNIEVVPGNHMVIIRRPFATDLGKALQRVIDRLCAENKL